MFDVTEDQAVGHRMDAKIGGHYFVCQCCMYAEFSAEVPTLYYDIMCNPRARVRAGKHRQETFNIKQSQQRMIKQCMITYLLYIIRPPSPPQPPSPPNPLHKCAPNYNHAYSSRNDLSRPLSSSISSHTPATPPHFITVPANCKHADSC